MTTFSTYLSLLLILGTLPHAYAEEAAPSPFVALQEEAVKAYEKNDFAKSLELAEQARQLYEESSKDAEDFPSYPKLLRLFAACLGKQGKFTEASGYLIEFAKITEEQEGDPSEVASAEALVAMYQFKLGQHAEGLEKMAVALKKLTAYKADGNIEIIEVYSIQCDLLMSIGLLKNAEIPCQKSGRPFIGRPIDLTYVTYPLLFARYNALRGDGIDLARSQLAHIEDYVRQSQAYPSHKNYMAITWGIYVATADLNAAKGREFGLLGDEGLMLDYYLNSRRSFSMAEKISDKDPAAGGLRLSEGLADSRTAAVMMSALHDLRSVDPDQAQRDLDRAEGYLRRAMERADHPDVLLNARLHQQLAQLLLIRARLEKVQVDTAVVEDHYHAALELYIHHLKEFASFENTLSLIPELLEEQDKILSDYLDFYFKNRAALKRPFPLGAWMAREGLLVKDATRLQAEAKDLIIDLRAYQSHDEEVIDKTTSNLAALVVTDSSWGIARIGPLSGIDFEKPETAYQKFWLPLAEIVGTRHLQRILMVKEAYTQDFYWDDYDLPAVKEGERPGKWKFADLGMKFVYPSSLSKAITVGDKK